MTPIEQLILKEIDKLHDRDNLRGIAENRERLLKDLLSRRRYEIRHEKITNHNGVIQNIADDVETLIDASPYIAASQASVNAKYVSPFQRPSEAARTQIAKDTEKALLTLSEMNGIVAKDKGNYEKSLWILAKNFVYELNEDGEVTFGKLNDNGLVSETRFRFEDLVPQHLIDSFRTDHKRKLANAALRDMAKSIVGEMPKNRRKGEKTDPSAPDQVDPIAAEMAAIRKNKILADIPARQIPFIPRSVIEKETMRREIAIRGMGDLEKVILGGGQPLADLQRIAKRQYEALNNTSAIEAQLKAIQPQGPAKYPELSYND